jgi:hypothetical protein
MLEYAPRVIYLGLERMPPIYETFNMCASMRKEPRTILGVAGCVQDCGPVDDSVHRQVKSLVGRGGRSM